MDSSEKRSIDEVNAYQKSDTIPPAEGGEFGKLADDRHTDIAYGLYKESLEMDPVQRELIAKKVLRKLDFIVLPMMCFIYFLQFLDKQTLNYANAYSLQKDLHLHGNEYSWVASITNLGYLVCAYPANIGLQKFPIGKFVGIALCIWGTLLMCMVASKNFQTIMALRFLLGGAESCIGPAWMLLTSMYWTRAEQPFRMSWWLGCNGLSSLAGAGIAYGLGHATHATLTPWQLIFLVVGILSFVSGIVAFILLPSDPNSCLFFTCEQKVVAVWRVSANRTGVKHTKILWYQVREAAKDPKVSFIAFQALSLGILNGSVTNFASSLLKGFGFSSLKTTLYQMPAGGFEFVCVVGGGYFASKVPNTLILTIIFGLLPGIAGMIGIAVIPLTHQIALAACTWLQGIFGLSIILTWSLVAANVSGHTKRSTVNGVEFVFYAAGNIIGPFLFFPTQAPRYLTAIKTLAGMYGACILFTTCIGLLMLMENRRRNKIALPEEVVDEQGFRDRTDVENKGFRYKL